MPCYDPQPTDREIKAYEVSELIIFVSKKILTPAPDWVREIHDFGKLAYPTGEDNLDKVTQYLCSILNSLKQQHPVFFESLVYNAKCKESRKLADWWEEHDKFDKNRK